MPCEHLDCVQHPRRIAVTLRKDLERTLNEMEHQGVIVKAEDNTDWVNNLVLVKRNTRLSLSDHFEKGSRTTTVPKANG